MDIHITPGPLSGTLLIPPSKYMVHRALICAGLSEGISTIDNVSFSDDIQATVDVLISLGAGIDVRESAAYPGRKTLTIRGGGIRSQRAEGSTAPSPAPPCGLSCRYAVSRRGIRHSPAGAACPSAPWTNILYLLRGRAS